MPFVSKALTIFSSAQKYIIIGLVVALAATNFGWHLTQVSLDTVRLNLDKEVLGRKNDRLSYESAQAKAAVLAYEEKTKKEAADVARSKKADEDYIALMHKYNASLLRYQTNQRPTSTINLPVTPDTPDGSDGSSESTGIFITMSDANICTENTARIQVVHDWATKK